MIVRCGRCGTEFDVPGPGRHGCPTCGAVNQVVVAGGPPGQGPPMPQPAPPPPSPPPKRATCPECSFDFIHGPVPEVVCPNCGTAVTVGGEAEEDGS